jgi:hypothetical protein
MLIQAGIRRVVAVAPSADGNGKWDKRGRLALTMFKEASVGFVPIDEAMNASLIEKYNLQPKKSKKMKKAAPSDLDACC